MQPLEPKAAAARRGEGFQLGGVLSADVGFGRYSRGQDCGRGIARLPRTGSCVATPTTQPGIRSSSGTAAPTSQLRSEVKKRIPPGSLALDKLTLDCASFGTRISEPQARTVVDAALDVGIRCFGASDVYGLGQSEEMLGRLLVGAAGPGRHCHQIRDEHARGERGRVGSIIEGVPPSGGGVQPASTGHRLHRSTGGTLLIASLLLMRRSAPSMIW
jgi:hypothetical protein